MWITLLALLTGCPSPEPASLPEVALGVPLAGAAEGSLALPVGTPLGGYTARCGCIPSGTGQDFRTSPYADAFVESTGVQTRPGIKVVWLDNDDDSLVLIKVDLIYSYDGLVDEVTRQLEAATGEHLAGRVVVAASHSHSSYGPFSDQIAFYLGGDEFNQEIFVRVAQQLTAVALDAYDAREPVALGTSWHKDWDPNSRVYHDRRSENDDLAVWDDAEPGYDKDPYLNLLRIDHLDGSPLAVVFTFGVHGTVLDADNSMASGDASEHIELGLQEAWDHPVVVMHLQGAAGDASPGGQDSGYARLESLGEIARPMLLNAWETTPTSADPIRMETASRSVWQDATDIHVTRNGTVDWRYADQVAVEDANPDNVVYDENGVIEPVFDEFNAPNGAVFCGDGDFEIPVGKIGADVFPYDQCIDVELMSHLITAFFDLEDVPVPLPASLKASTTVTRLGPIPTRGVDGEVVSDDLFGGFFPAEPTGMYAEQWRRRVKAELGHDMAWMVGYAQDHEGYFLIPEDWLVGGYEPNIALWGPLQGEYVMEEMLRYGDAVLNTDVREDPDPWGWYANTQYTSKPLPDRYQPDMALAAGSAIMEAPEYLWLPQDLTLDLAPMDTVARVDGMVQIAWLGGDPMVDDPRVVLERETDAGWEEVTTHSGRPVTEAMPDILLSETPDPLYPATADQIHQWWAAWQAVGHDGDRTALPLGTYRLRVNGKTYAGGNTHWPWATTPYTLEGAPFELVGADVRSERTADGLWLWIDGPEQGYRLVDLEGSSRGANPVRGEVTFTLDGGATVLASPVEVAGGRSRFVVDLGTGDVSVEDAVGNTGFVSGL